MFFGVCCGIFTSQRASVRRLVGIESLLSFGCKRRNVVAEAAVAALAARAAAAIPARIATPDSSQVAGIKRPVVGCSIAPGALLLLAALSASGPSYRLGTESFPEMAKSV